jgi:ubiquinone/menaquinone biosynthesis C-methylase UbiE
MPTLGHQVSPRIRRAWRQRKHVRYMARHVSLAVVLSRLSALWHRTMDGRLPHTHSEKRHLRQRLFDLFAADLTHAGAGDYPEALLDQFPLISYLSRVPNGIGEFPRIWARRRRGAHHEVPTTATGEYPAYYERTFHWQSDGWLSDRSAAMYDPGVEFLFGGTADVMRRMIIPDVVKAVRNSPTTRILDVACGTGRFLGQLRSALPEVTLIGIDLSPFYVQFARGENRQKMIEFETANAEALPYPDNEFDAVTCVFLFHELPKDVRRTVAREMLRVVKPGGTIAILDSEQLASGHDIGSFLEEFPAIYHEPYYRSFLRDDLVEMWRHEGLLKIDARSHFTSRAVIGQKRLGN